MRGSKCNRLYDRYNIYYYKQQAWAWCMHFIGRIKIFEIAQQLVCLLHIFY